MQQSEVVRSHEENDDVDKMTINLDMLDPLMNNIVMDNLNGTYVVTIGRSSKR
jgi:hypothetical protein